MTPDIERNPNITCLFTKDDWDFWYKQQDRETEPQVCKKCHARFCCYCRLKPFLVEFIDISA